MELLFKTLVLKPTRSRFTEPNSTIIVLDGKSVIIELAESQQNLLKELCRNSRKYLQLFKNQKWWSIYCCYGIVILTCQHYIIMILKKLLICEYLGILDDISLQLKIETIYFNINVKFIKNYILTLIDLLLIKMLF